MAASSSSKTLVQPTVPLVPGVSELTPLDQYMIRVVLPIMCVFRLGPSASWPTVVSDLQAGLASAVDQLNFLAADIVTESDEDDTMHLEYGDEAGVWFYTGELPDIEYDTLERRSFPMSEMTVERFAPAPLGHSNRCPALTIKATLISGGLVLAFNIHHSIVDGQGIGTFLQVWSSCTAAASEGRLPDDFDAAALDASGAFSPRMPRDLSEFPTFKDTGPRPYETAQAHIMQLAVAGDHPTLTQLNRLSHWLLPEAKLAALRAAAAPTAPTHPSVTENAALSALVWTHVSAARRLGERGVPASSLLTAVNVRKRMEPALADEYPGNAIVLGRATATVGELGAGVEGGLYGLARRIGDSVDWWTAERVWSLTGAVQALSPVANTMVPPLDYDILVTSPAKMIDILGRCEWGDMLGRAKSLRWAFPSFLDGLAVILPSLNGGIEIQLWTAAETTERLKNDAAWNAWVEQIE